MLWHNGGTGGFRAFAGFVPAADVGAVVLANDLRSVDRMGVDLLTAAGLLLERACRVRGGQDPLEPEVPAT